MLSRMSDPWSNPPGGGDQPPPPPPPSGSPPPPPPPPTPSWSAPPPPPPSTPSWSAPPPPPSYGSTPGAGPGTGYGPTPAYTGVQGGSGQKTNTLAIVALVAGIVSLISCGFCTPLLPAGGIITGIMGRNQIRASNGLEKGDGLALAGLITAGIGLLFSLGVVALWIGGLVSGS